jgi:hypothetical protein
MASQEWNVYRRGPGDYIVHKGQDLRKVHAERGVTVHFPTQWDAEAIRRRLNEQEQHA